MICPFPLKIAGEPSCLYPVDRRPGLGRARVREVGSEVEVGGELVAPRSCLRSSVCRRRLSRRLRLASSSYGCAVSVEVVADGVELLEGADVDEAGVQRVRERRCWSPLPTELVG